MSGHQQEKQIGLQKGYPASDCGNKKFPKMLQGQFCIVKNKVFRLNFYLLVRKMIYKTSFIKAEQVEKNFSAVTGLFYIRGRSLTHAMA